MSFKTPWEKHGHSPDGYNPKILHSFNYISTLKCPFRLRRFLKKNLPISISLQIKHEQIHLRNCLTYWRKTCRKNSPGLFKGATWKGILTRSNYRMGSSIYSSHKERIVYSHLYLSIYTYFGGYGDLFGLVQTGPCKCASPWWVSW